MLTFIRKRLWLEFIVFLSVFMILILGAIIGINIMSQSKANRVQSGLQNRMLADAVEGGMFDALAVGDNDIVIKQFQRLHDHLKDLKVFVFDFNGKISFSTEVDAAGTELDSWIPHEAADRVKQDMDTGVESDTVHRGRIGGEPFSVFSKIIPNEKRCYHCHGSSRKVLGGISVCSSEKAALASLANTRLQSILVGASGLLALVAVVWFLFHTLVNKKIALILEATRAMRQGDFTRTCPVKGEDEISHILARFNLVNQELRTTISSVINSSLELQTSSTDLNGLSGELSSGAEETSEKAEALAHASGQMTSSLSAVAVSMEETSANISIVASASEEMNATITEIARSASTGKDIMNRAVKGFDSVAGVVDELGKASQEIDVVTDEIRSISEQVSLLALNAKIEAARAGDAGKGFAVVAEEITELATETARSTIKVDEKLSWMKQKAFETAEEIRNVSGLVTESENAIAAIAAAVEEQAITTNEISINISEIAGQVNRVNKTVESGVGAADDCARDIVTVETAARHMESNAHRVNDKAELLSGMADTLNRIMKRFTV